MFPQMGNELTKTEKFADLQPHQISSSGSFDDDHSKAILDGAGVRHGRKWVNIFAITFKKFFFGV